MIIPESLIDAFHQDEDHEAVALVIADWLDEHDHTDEARFIRLSVALQQQPDHPEWEDWRDTAERLRLGIRHANQPDFAFWQAVPPADAGLCGLPRGDALPQFMTDQLATTLARGISLTNDDGTQLERLLAQPTISRLAHLEITGTDTDSEVMQSLLLANADRLRLRTLRLPMLTRSLTGTLIAPTLESLDVALANPAMILDVAEAGHLPRLRDLTLRCGGVNSFSRLDRDPEIWVPLRSLRIDGHPVDRVAMRYLGRWLSDTPIERFAFIDAGRRTNHVPIDGLVDAATSTPHLRELDFTGTYLPAQAIHRLATWPGLATIRTLRLCPSGIDDAALMNLAHSEYAINLRELDIRGGDYTPLGILGLCDSPLAERLRWIALGSRVESLGEDWREVFIEMARTCVNLRRLRMAELVPDPASGIIPWQIHWPALREVSLPTGQGGRVVEMLLTHIVNDYGLIGLWGIHFDIPWNPLEVECVFGHREIQQRYIDMYPRRAAPNWTWRPLHDLVRTEGTP